MGVGREKEWVPKVEPKMGPQLRSFDLNRINWVEGVEQADGDRNHGTWARRRSIMNIVQ